MILFIVLLQRSVILCGDDMTKAVWEILVPTISNDGRPFKLKFHRVWDQKVKEISGGMTIQAVSKVDGFLHLENYLHN